MYHLGLERPAVVLLLRLAVALDDRRKQISRRMGNRHG
jgi:hypothetical protein